MLPKSVGRYKILDKIGSGGMAVVYLGRDEMFDRPVAVKVLPTNLGQDPENRERFRREAKAIASLEHAAVVPVYDYGEDGDQLFLVMRYMQGGSLKDRLTRGRLPLAAAAAILRRIASALDKAHSMGMVHRDIKPGNVLFDLEDNPYITDFGLVKMVEVSVQLTHSEFFGTPAYTSPEQCQGDKSIDARADVYSLAAVFFHMITGSAPYQSNNAMALLMKHVSDPIPRLADAAADLPHALQAVINRGMAKSPSDRYLSTGELAKDVDRILASLPQSEPAAAPSIWGSEPAPAAGSYSATESGRALSFEALRPPPKKAPAAADEAPTRRESIPPGRVPAVPAAAAPEAPADPEATNAVEFREIPAERRRLEWKPQADTAPPLTEANAAPAPSVPAAKPSQLSYTEPPKPLEKKPAGIPILVFIVVLLVISLLYFAFQKGLF
jgi:serine/threonine protein kinase